MTGRSPHEEEWEAGQRRRAEREERVRVAERDAAAGKCPQPVYPPGSFEERFQRYYADCYAAAARKQKREHDEGQSAETREWAARQQEPAPAPTAQPQPHPARRKPLSPELKKRRRNMRVAELKTFRWHAAPTKRFEQWSEELRRQLGGRDPFDELQVSRQELGTVLNLTLSIKMAIEDKATEHRRAKGWGGLFRFRTVAACDVTPEEAARAYRKRANAERSERRKAARSQAANLKKMEDRPMTMQLSTSYATRAELKAANMARTKGQLADLLKAIGDGKARVAELVEAVRHLPHWHGLDEEKLYRTVIDRLDMLLAKGLIRQRYEPSPRGRELRVVSRCN